MKDSKKINNYSNGTFEFQIKHSTIEPDDPVQKYWRNAAPNLDWENTTFEERLSIYQESYRDRLNKKTMLLPYQIHFVIVEK